MRTRAIKAVRVNSDTIATGEIFKKTTINDSQNEEGIVNAFCTEEQPSSQEETDPNTGPQTNAATIKTNSKADKNFTAAEQH
jgi:hypothetical protein